MGRKLLWSGFVAVLAVLGIVLGPAIGQAQEGWPPLEVQTALVAQETPGLFRLDVILVNVSNIDLLDVIVTASLPEGATFNRFEALDYATTGFDGKAVSFIVLQLPARKTIGPMSAYLEIGEVDPNSLRTSIFAQWQGQMPGSIFVPDAPLGSVVGAATPENPTATLAPPPTGVTPTAQGQPLATPQPEKVSTPTTPGTRSLWELLAELEAHEFVDLTHTFGPGIPRWPGFPDAEFKTIYDYDTDGFFAQEFVHVGQYGTHMDPPAHFHKGLRTVDDIELKEMIAPLVVINVADKVAANPDYELTVDDVNAWEAKYGPIPPGAFVAMRSDWSKRWPNVEAFFNKDGNGQAHYPGWTTDALKFLYEERQIVGNGHETLDTDAAVAQVKTGLAAETYVLGTNHYQIELMSNLDKVPETGAIIFAVVPKPKNGSGFPARVFAVLP